MDKMILNYSILNGALELLPQSLASMAIIPLQMKMVYRDRQGARLRARPRPHQGLPRHRSASASPRQYLEQFGRKLIGGLLGKAGRRAGGAARQRRHRRRRFSFATTYALGQVAEALLRRRPHDEHAACSRTPSPRCSARRRACRQQLPRRRSSSRRAPSMSKQVAADGARAVTRCIGRGPSSNRRYDR
ncbi:MAG: hypothetical protein MZV65_47870 [Chromatiales bacterium]|nr:hypothetical protein [Chromatiales bacterium]